MVMRTNQNWFWVRFFKRVVPLSLKHHFEEIIVQHNYTYSTKPVLLIANHSSWWDGWIAFQVSHFLLKKNFFFMMLKKELNLRKVLYQIGGFAIEPDQRSLISSLRYASRLLHESNNLVLIYPQAKLFSQHTTTFKFEKGVELLANKMLKDTDYDIVMLYFTTEYFEKKKASAYVYLHHLKDEKADLESKYQDFASQCIQKHQSIQV